MIENAELPYSCWECGERCEELAPLRGRRERTLVGPCCQPEREQPENEVTPKEAAALDAECDAIFGPRTAAAQTKEAA